VLEIVSEMVFCLVMALLLGFSIGFLLGRESIWEVWGRKAQFLGRIKEVSGFLIGFQESLGEGVKRIRKKFREEMLARRIDFLKECQMRVGI